MNYRRLKKKKDFSRLLKEGKRAHAPTLTVVYLPSDGTRMAVCVGKKHGKSVQRNRVKRLLREAFRIQAEHIAACDLLLIPKVSGEYSFAAFKRDIGKILLREKLIEGNAKNNLRAEP